jgi:transketolase
MTARVAVELGTVMGWCKYIGCRGRFVGMTGFGASAPIGVLLKHFGITAENIVTQAKAVIAASVQS